MQEGRPIVYYSRKMTAAERNYVVTEQELLATVEALRVFRCYLLSGKQFNDNRPKTFLQSQPILSRRQARWSEYLQRFHFNWVHRAGRHNVADPLSRNPAFKHLNALLAVSTRRSGSTTGTEVGTRCCRDLWRVLPLTLQCGTCFTVSALLKKRHFRAWRYGHRLYHEIPDFACVPSSRGQALSITGLCNGEHESSALHWHALHTTDVLPSAEMI